MQESSANEILLDWSADGTYLGSDIPHRGSLPRPSYFKAASASGAYSSLC